MGFNSYIINYNNRLSERDLVKTLGYIQLIVASESFLRLNMIESINIISKEYVEFETECDIKCYGKCELTEKLVYLHSKEKNYKN